MLSQARHSFFFFGKVSYLCGRMQVNAVKGSATRIRMKFQRELAGSLTHTASFMWLGCLWRPGHGAAASGPARVSCCIHGLCTEKGGTRGGSFCLEVWSCRRFKPCLSCKSFRQPHRITWKTLCHSVFRTVHQCFQFCGPSVIWHGRI